MLRQIAICVFVYKSAGTQTFLTEKVISFFADKYDLVLNVEDVDIKLPNRIILDKLYLQDESGDTLVYSNKVLAKVSALKLSEKRIYISEVLLDNPKIYVDSDTAGVYNFQFILDKFSPKETKEKKSGDGFDIFCESFYLKDVSMKMNNNPFSETPGVFNSSDLFVNNFSIKVSDLQLHGDSIELELNNLSFEEKSGIKLEKLSAYICITDTLYQLNNLFIQTENSLLHAPVVELAIIDTLVDDVFNDLSFNVDIDSSILGVEDAAYFMPSLKGFDKKVNFSAHLYGKLSDIKLKNLNFAYAKDTRLLADLSINGLPDIEQTFAYAKIKQLSSSVRDAQTIYLPPFEAKQKLQLPEKIQELGVVNYHGDLTGMFNDIVAYGAFETDYGKVSTDVGIKSDFKDRTYSFNGDIDIDQLQLGSIIGKTEMLGELSMAANLDGEIDSLGNYNLSMSSEIERVDFKKYPYSAINLSGRLTNESFLGEIMVDDPNLKVEFMGGYKIQNGIPDVDFRADMKANLDELNFDTVDSEAGFLLLADVNGNSINNANGNLQISNLFYRKEAEKVTINNLNINSHTSLVEQLIDIESDYFTINTSGKYKASELLSTLTSVVYNYYPVLKKEEKSIEPDHKLVENPGLLQIEVNLFNLSDLFDFFMPALDIPETIELKAVLDANNNNYLIDCSLPKVKFDTIYAENLEFSLSADSLDLNVDVAADYLNFKGFEVFNQFNLTTLSQGDSVQIDMSWDNMDSIRYAGDLKTSVLFERSLNDNIAINAHLYPSEFVIRNENWNLDESLFSKDSTEITVGNVKFYNSDQMIRFVGNVSDDPAKDLRFYIQNFDLSLFNKFLENKGYNVQGVFNSNGRLADAYGSLNFRSFFELNKLYVNNEEFGRVQINTNWDHLSNALRLDGNSRYIDFRGFLNPTTDSLDLTLNVNNFGLSVLEPYMVSAGLLDVRGKVDGNIDVTGKISDPDIYGALDFDRSGLTFDMLMSRFNLNDSIFIYTDSLVFRNFLIADEFGNPGLIQGKLSHHKFKDIKYDFSLGLDNYHIMNTKESDNAPYYGSVFVTANARISGGTESIVVDIPEATTEKNTVFVLPMSNTYDANDDPWITFIKDSVTLINLEDLIPKKKFDVSFLMNLDVTPDAETRLVFDPKVGDMIRANCDGNLSLEVLPNSEFKMKGELAIVGGDYLFTLQNIINKRFVLENGGTISWDGNPTEGQLNLKAVYKLNAPLYDIMVGIDTSDVYKSRTSVRCVMKMSGELLNPEIRFDIEVPDADEKAKTRVSSLSEDEINKQVLTLLVLNRFYTPDDMQMASSDSRGTNMAGAGGVTTFEMLSNQLSNWLSQISDDFDIGVNYSPGDEITNQELEVALSTQILNDRVLINGNVGVGEHENTTSDIVGDVEVQVKVNKSGNLRVKGFTRANSQSKLEYDEGPYTQGVGVFYTESFNTFKGLFKRYWSGLFSKKKKEMIPAEK